MYPWWVLHAAPIFGSLGQRSRSLRWVLLATYLSTFSSDKLSFIQNCTHSWAFSPAMQCSCLNARNGVFLWNPKNVVILWHSRNGVELGHSRTDLLSVCFTVIHIFLTIHIYLDLSNSVLTCFNSSVSHACIHMFIMPFDQTFPSLYLKFALANVS